MSRETGWDSTRAEGQTFRADDPAIRIHRFSWRMAHNWFSDNIAEGNSGKKKYMNISKGITNALPV